jgi:hypothetical protein
MDQLFVSKELNILPHKKGSKFGKKFVTSFNRNSCDMAKNSHRRKESKRALKNLVRLEVEEIRSGRSSSRAKDRFITQTQKQKEDQQAFESETQAAYLKRTADVRKPGCYQSFINAKFINHMTG